DAALERVTAGEPQHRVNAAGRERPGGRADVSAAAVHGGIGSESLYESEPILARGGGQHAGAAQVCKLHRDASHAATGAMDDERLAGLDMQGVIDALDGSERSRGDGAGILEAEPNRNGPDAFRRHGHVLGIEPAPGVVPAVGVDLLADLEV